RRSVHRATRAVPRRLRRGLARVPAARRRCRGAARLARHRRGPHDLRHRFQRTRSQGVRRGAARTSDERRRHRAQSRRPAAAGPAGAHAAAGGPRAPPSRPLGRGGRALGGAVRGLASAGRPRWGDRSRPRAQLPGHPRPRVAPTQSTAHGIDGFASDGARPHGWTLVDAHRELLAVLLVIYFIVMLGIGAWAQGRIHDSEDYLVAGRRLPLLLAWPTLLATWFGAGALLTSTDQIRREGLRMAALDPFGAGLCLLLAGWWLARPLWHMKLLTLGDFFRRRFGPRAEVATSLMMVPTCFGWIAAQFVAVAELFQLVFGLDRSLGIAGIALLGTTYTLLGGMWSVTLTDVVQMACIVVGLLFLAGEVLVALGG